MEHNTGGKAVKEPVFIDLIVRIEKALSDNEELIHCMQMTANKLGHMPEDPTKNVVEPQPDKTTLSGSLQDIYNRLLNQTERLSKARTHFNNFI